MNSSGQIYGDHRLQIGAMLQQWGLQPSSRFFELAVDELLHHAETKMFSPFVCGLKEATCSPQVMPVNYCRLVLAAMVQKQALQLAHGAGLVWQITCTSAYDVGHGMHGKAMRTGPG